MSSEEEKSLLKAIDIADDIPAVNGPAITAIGLQSLFESAVVSFHEPGTPLIHGIPKIIDDFIVYNSGNFNQGFGAAFLCDVSILLALGERRSEESYQIASARAGAVLGAGLITGIEMLGVMNQADPKDIPAGIVGAIVYMLGRTAKNQRKI